MVIMRFFPTAAVQKMFSKRDFELARLENLSKIKDKIKWEHGSIPVIKEKIVHYEKTGNHRKLQIYMSKLEGKQNVFARLNRLKKFYGDI